MPRDVYYIDFKIWRDIMKNKICLLLASCLCLILLLLYNFSDNDSSAFNNNISNEISSDNISPDNFIEENYENLIYDDKYKISKTDTANMVDAYFFRLDKTTKRMWSPDKDSGDIWLSSLVINDTPLLLRDNMISSRSENFAKNHIDQLELYNKFANEIFTLNKNSLKYIKAKDYYTIDSTGYDSLTDDNIIMITSNNANPILNKVKYTDYTISVEQPKDIWVETFKTEIFKLNNNIPDTPIIINEAWTFNYDSQVVEIVTATNMTYNHNYLQPKTNNTFDNYKKDAPNISNGLHIGYRLTLLFIDGRLDTTHDDWVRYPTEYVVFQREDFFPEQDSNVTTYGHSFYQYDNDKNIVDLPVFTPTAYDNLDTFKMWTSYMFADIDADGKSEIIKWHDIGHVSNPLSLDVYNLFENTKLPKSFCPIYEKRR